MFGRQKKNDIPMPLNIPAPRRYRKGGMETLLVFVEKCAGRPLRDWEANVIETLAKAAGEDEAMHG